MVAQLLLREVILCGNGTKPIPETSQRDATAQRLRERRTQVCLGASASRARSSQPKRRG
ncbi:hypothetical protein BN13_310002 [Nostocoides jenkinsii Ben 74]|uniref:Uncharacterized protein n=1 Tax=Nostocoides jenkinsii Ben 74 TaxID=1193518 RepID=A0A077M976_9MICO|nr:hypothetical protein BN13_310002 [Tetrasphaera jenkinsii Ben 74]